MEDIMTSTRQDEYTDRNQAIKMRLAGQSVAQICHTVGRCKAWFHKWWGRYLEFGPDGLFDLTRANHQVVRRIPPELERTILTIRRRLESRSRPDTRYRLIGATAIWAELKALQYPSLPCPRTIERVLERHRLTAPKIRLARALPQSLYPGPRPHDSNQLHQIDPVGPLYLKGQPQRYYIFVCKDAFDGAVCLTLNRSRQMDHILAFLGECWKTLGRPAQVQFDNAREMCGWGRAARHLSRVIRLCLRFGVEPVFIPPARPPHQGSVENFNGWFQPLLLHRHFARPGDLAREVKRLQQAVNSQHVHQHLGGLTAEQYRRRKKLQKLPHRFLIPTDPLPIAAGRVTFIRVVSPQGTIKLLSQTFTIGKRFKGRYVKAVLDTHRGVFKRWPYKLVNQ
jgi:transposase InsO family protein